VLPCARPELGSGEAVGEEGHGFILPHLPKGLGEAKGSTDAT